MKDLFSFRLGNASAILIAILFCSGCVSCPPPPMKQDDGPLFKREKMTFSENRAIPFSFNLKKHGDYSIYITDLNNAKDAQHLSGDVKYTLVCKSVNDLREKEALSGYKKQIIQQGFLFYMSGQVEEEKRRVQKDFFNAHFHSLMDISFFDNGDIGREINCVLQFSMSPNDYFEASLVVKEDLTYFPALRASIREANKK